MAGLLDKTSILERLDVDPPLVDGLIDRTTQVQPNGVDLTLNLVASYAGKGTADFSNERRVLPETRALQFEDSGALHLDPGPYLVQFNEVVNLPLDLAALGRTRSSLLRSGVALHTAVWDSGYSGRSQCLLTIYNPNGFTLYRDARILQLVFLSLTKPVAEGYQGLYSGENLPSQK